MAPSRVAFTIGAFSIYWYGILIALGVLLAAIACMRSAKRRGMSPDNIIDLMLAVIPLALVCARLYFVIFSWENYASDPLLILDFRSGGMAFYGGLIGGALGVLIFVKWKKVNFFDLADIVVPGVALGQAIGRWGNYINQEAFGEMVTTPSLQFFPFSVYIEQTGSWHLATFFYEFLACLALFVVLQGMGRKPRARGVIMAWYFIGYGMERSIVESFRTDSLWWGHLRVSQILSLVFVLAGVVCLAVRGRRSAGYVAMGFGALWTLISALGLDLLGNPALSVVLGVFFIAVGAAALLYARSRMTTDGEADERLRIIRPGVDAAALEIQEILIEDEELIGAEDGEALPGADSTACGDMADEAPAEPEAGDPGLEDAGGESA